MSGVVFQLYRIINFVHLLVCWSNLPDDDENPRCGTGADPATARLYPRNLITSAQRTARGTRNKNKIKSSYIKLGQKIKHLWRGN